jgi:hypothetical protein
MPISLIKKNQLDPNIADLVGQYGSGFFLPIRVSGDLTGFIVNAIQGLNIVSGVNGLNRYVNITGISGIDVSVITGTNTVQIAYTGIPVPPNIVYTTGDQTISGNKTFVNRPSFNNGLMVTSNDTGIFYTNNNPSGYITGVDLTAYALNSNTGSFVTTAQTGAFYGASNPSGFITGVDLTPYALNADLTGIYATYAQLTGLSGYEASVHNLLVTYEQLTGYSGFQATVDAAFATYSELTGLSGYSATVTNLQTTGSGLLLKINALSGRLTGDYATLENLKTGISGSVQVAIAYSILNSQIYTSGLSGYLYPLITGLSSTVENIDFYPNSNPSGYITGVNLTPYALTADTGSFVTTGYQFNGDLTGLLPSLTIDKIQGNPVSAQSPLGGQTLQWNGSAWVPGAVPAGGNGGGGEVYYFNFANTTGIAPTGGLPTTGDHPISLLGKNYDVGSGQATSAELDPRFTERLICSFVTASGSPGVTDIPAGLWDFNIWASVNSASTTQSSIRAVVNIYNPATSGYRYLATTDDVYLYEADTIAQYILNATVPQTGIASNERLYIQIFGKKYTTNNRNITIYFDSYRPSHVNTTLPSVAGNGVVKVINGVMQTPATGIFDSDVDANAAIQQSKIQGLSTSLAALYPNTNPSGYVSSSDVTSIVYMTESGYNSITPVSGILYIVT